MRQRNCSEDMLRSGSLPPPGIISHKVKPQASSSVPAELSQSRQASCTQWPCQYQHSLEHQWVQWFNVSLNPEAEHPSSLWSDADLWEESWNHHQCCLSWSRILWPCNEVIYLFFYNKKGHIFLGILKGTFTYAVRSFLSHSLTCLQPGFISSPVVFRKLSRIT